MPSTVNHSRLRIVRRGFLAALIAGLVIIASSRLGIADERRVSFTNDVVPILTKAGCNVGVCHAKAGGGQNGFQLSLLGFEPQEDFEHLVKEGRGRRLFPTVPDRSLLLLKASGQVPHGGGVRLNSSSESYALLREWIRQGASADGETTPKLVGFELQPERSSLGRQTTQQLKRRWLAIRTGPSGT